MHKIRIESLISEVERRIANPSFGESNKNFIVVRLNDDLTEKIAFKKVLSNFELMVSKQALQMLKTHHLS